MIALSGCSETVNPIKSTSVVPAQQVGFVNISAIEQNEPESSTLKSIDNQLGTASAYQVLDEKAPTPLSVRQYMQKVLSIGTVDIKTGLEAEQEQRFSAVSSAVLAELNNRLSASDALQATALKNERTANDRTKLSNAEAEFDNAAISESAAFSTEASNIATLRMQVAAMKVNENPPPTAPRGYWLNIEQERQSMLMTALSAYNTKLKAIFDARNAQVAAAKESIDNDTADAVGEYQTTADQQRAAAIQAASARFNKEQSELNSEDDQVLEQAEQVVSSKAGGVLELNEPVTSSSDVSTVSAQNLTGLRAYRDLLQTKMRKIAIHTINLIANELNVRVTAERRGVPDLTPVFVRVMKSQSWKVS